MELRAEAREEQPFFVIRQPDRLHTHTHTAMLDIHEGVIRSEYTVGQWLAAGGPWAKTITELPAYFDNLIFHKVQLFPTCADEFTAGVTDVLLPQFIN